jgi:hypothetical protein
VQLGTSGMKEDELQLDFRNEHEEKRKYSRLAVECVPTLNLESDSLNFNDKWQGYRI